eukprot:2683935-Amphidinium_carterae.1
MRGNMTDTVSCRSMLAVLTLQSPPKYLRASICGLGIKLTSALIGVGCVPEVRSTYRVEVTEQIQDALARHVLRVATSALAAGINI